MHTAHLVAVLAFISRHTGLAQAVTSRTFRTSFAFKIVLKIPDWRFADRIGHTCGDTDPLRSRFAPTHGLLETRSSAANADPVAQDSVSNHSPRVGTSASPFWSRYGQLYKGATLYTCRVCSCLDSDWHSSENNV